VVIPDVLHTIPSRLHGREQCVELPLPGLAALWLKRIAD